MTNLRVALDESERGVKDKSILSVFLPPLVLPGGVAAAPPYSLSRHRIVINPQASQYFPSLPLLGFPCRQSFADCRP
jgi:hypothetical protein